ncbi:MAG: tail fiber domain-containing protein [Bradyrhizobium sp.]|uniref:tail fiber domain-containing protein n=1 Tax=Bradyrhizobium sp. TaxID=376 RepID=UPI002727C8A6|nr:tail fiber domain-containing protein [Bradyrhizobium sp.]MDO8398905.1 tail fiber domain-containing protein [Bradyrhizobium sp.]
MPFPVTINGNTYAEADFSPYGYVTAFPAIIDDIATVAAAIEAAASGIVVGSLTVTGTSASLIAAGRQGATDPVLQVDASTASVVTGLKIKGAAAAGGLALSVISSGTNENLTIDAKGSGTIRLGATSTGAVEFSRNAVPTASDGAALGTSALMWSDLFLASGSVINWNNGDVTLTHSADALTLAGGDLTLNANLSIGTSSSHTTTFVGKNITANNDFIINSTALYVETSTPRVAIGTNVLTEKLHINAATGSCYLHVTSAGAGGATATDGLLVGVNSANDAIFQFQDTGDMIFYQEGTIAMRIFPTTLEVRAQSIYDITTATAANVNVDSAGDLNRSTSSILYKDNIKPIDIFEAAENVLKYKPITYTSKCSSDDPTQRHLGFIAEQGAKVNPLLASYRDELDEFGNPTGEKHPDGWQYERMTVEMVAFEQVVYQKLKKAGIW